METGNKILIIAALIAGITFTACSNEPGVTDSSNSKQDVTDYSNPERWLNVPVLVNKDVDVFYLYPTSWQKVDSTEPNICAIDNPLMLKYSKLAFLRQAAVFDTIANIYAPYYRQDDAVYALSLSVAEQEKLVGGIPKADAFAAFNYYIKNYNNGRPFILASHSQGSAIMKFLLIEYMKDNPEVYKRMIAAYVIGYSITNDDLVKNPHLKFAQGPDDIGVIISYNTQSPDVVPGTNSVVQPGAIAINPITWTREETLAAAQQNLGSILLNKDGSVVLSADGKISPVLNYADARVDKANGVVICTTADVDKLAPGNSLFPRGVFHSFDYPFYYFNLRQNAINRTKKYLGR